MRDARYLHAGDPVRAAAWLYYGAEKTQSEVAALLGVSRQTVAAYLGEARRAGHVTIHLAPDILERNGLAERLAQCHGLAGVHVVPAGDDPAEQRDRVGRAGAEVLGALVREGMVLGVSSGRTVSALAGHLRSRSMDRVTVLQVSGSSINAADHSPEICASTVASALGARCLNLHAPAFVSSEALARSLRAEPALQQHFTAISRADMILFGIGELSDDTVLDQPPYLTAAIRDRYIVAGAVGLAFDRFIDDGGAELDGPLRLRTMAVELAAAVGIPLRLAVCSGQAKARAVSAALQAGLVTHLVVDVAMARALVEEECNDG